MSPDAWLATRFGTFPGLRYRRLAVAGAGGYLLLASSWIVLSTSFSAGIAATTEELFRFEMAKGIAFVVVTTGIFFFVLLAVFREIARREETIIAQKEALLEAERSVIASILGSSVAHDLKNNITTARMAIDELNALHDHLDADVIAALDSSLGSMTQLCEDLVRAGRAELAGTRERFPLGDCIRHAVSAASHHPSTRGAKVIVGESLPGTSLSGSSALVSRAIVNAVINAGEAGAGNIRVSAGLNDRELRLTIDDDGPGIDDADRERVLDPLFSTKGTGHGLGLSSLVACAQFHDGRVEISRADAGGARFIVTFDPELLEDHA